MSGTEIPRLPRALLRVLLPREIRASAIEDISLAYRRDGLILVENWFEELKAMVES